MSHPSELETDREPRFFALIPFLVFIAFYVGLSVWAGDFYRVPMPIAFVIASASALLLNRKHKLSDRVEVYARGMGETNIMIMCLIFILAGAFASTAKATGSVDSAVILARHLLPGNLMLAGIFLVSCFISLAIGTSCGTIAALTPIAIGLTEQLGLSAGITIGAVVGGSMFGDNMSMISDTTIAATRTQNVGMKEKFYANLKIVIPAAAVTLIAYVILGKSGASAELPPIQFKDFLLILPYLFVLVFALIGWNVMVLLFTGTILAAVVGMLYSGMGFWKALDCAQQGALGMSETMIVAILAGGLLKVIRWNGGIGYIMQKIEHMVHNVKGCEFGILLLVCAVNLFTANNTVAIVIAGPIALELAAKYHVDPKRSASILDTGSCFVQGIIPYGAQILIALGAAKASHLPVSAGALIGHLYYPFLTLAALLISIFIVGKKTGK